MCHWCCLGAPDLRELRRQDLQEETSGAFHHLLAEVADVRRAWARSRLQSPHAGHAMCGEEDLEGRGMHLCGFVWICVDLY